MIAISRWRIDPTTQAYVARKKTEQHCNPEILRCLKLRPRGRQSHRAGGRPGHSQGEKPRTVQPCPGSQILTIPDAA